MSDYYVERTGGMLVYIPVKRGVEWDDTVAIAEPVYETSPHNAFLRNVG